MQNNTSKMVTLLGKIRKQMNGAVLDTFRYYGAKYGMNYGVAIHSIREMAAEQGTDHDLAKFLYRQQVRELQIIALWIADARRVVDEELDFWRVGIVNSEIAEQAAQGLLCNIADIEKMLDNWCSGDDSIVAYAALLAASRSGKVGAECVERAVVQAVTNHSDNHLVAQGAIALLASIITKDRLCVERTITKLPQNRSAELITEEIKWRLEYSF